MNQDGIWLSILEYANIKKISISTIRRSIKAGHIKYKEENGKYFVWTIKKIEVTSGEYNSKEEIEKLKKENRKLLEEINDLQTLLVAYEYQNRNSFESLPHLPEVEL
jgi:cell division protein FtsB